MREAYTFLFAQFRPALLRTPKNEFMGGRKTVPSYRDRRREELEMIAMCVVVARNQSSLKTRPCGVRPMSLKNKNGGSDLAIPRGK